MGGSLSHHENDNASNSTDIKDVNNNTNGSGGNNTYQRTSTGVAPSGEILPKLNQDFNKKGMNNGSGVYGVNNK